MAHVLGHQEGVYLPPGQAAARRGVGGELPLLPGQGVLAAAIGGGLALCQHGVGAAGVAQGRP
eukprot:6729836-Pyramimonas_sp.AAC.1